MWRRVVRAGKKKKNVTTPKHCDAKVVARGEPERKWLDTKTKRELNRGWNIRNIIINNNNRTPPKKMFLAVRAWENMCGSSVTQSVSWRGWNLSPQPLDCGLWQVPRNRSRTRTTTVPGDRLSRSLSSLPFFFFFGWGETGASLNFSPDSTPPPEPRRCSAWTRVAPVRAAQSVWEGRHCAPCRPETWWSTAPAANGPSWTGSSSTCWTARGTPSASSAASATATSPRSASPGTGSSTAKLTFSGNKGAREGEGERESGFGAPSNVCSDFSWQA